MGTDSSLTERIDLLVSKATDEFNRTAQLGRVLGGVPLLGKAGVYLAMSRCLGTLEKAFNLGYVPGSKKVLAWQNTDLVSAVDVVCWPENRQHFLAESARAAQVLKEQTYESGVYDGYVVTGTKTDRIECYPTGSAQYRQLEWGNEERAYWLFWIGDMKHEAKNGIELGMFKHGQISYSPSSERKR